MSVQPRTQETVSEAQTSDPRDDYILVGVDAKGASHVYRTTDETVHVIEGGERSHREDLGQRSVNKWIDYVATERGWATQYLFKTMAGAIGGSI